LGINYPNGLLIFVKLIENKWPAKFHQEDCGAKTSILQKRTRELIENNGSAPQNGIERTEKQSGEAH
jgi:hypothetical protein